MSMLSLVDNLHSQIAMIELCTTLVQPLYVNLDLHPDYFGRNLVNDLISMHARVAFLKGDYKGLKLHYTKLYNHIKVYVNGDIKHDLLAKQTIITFR